ncbi:MAG TPA: UDP-N-acetylmuramate dehydrogenase [Candidatus Kryptonia bacterium]
MHYLTLSSAYYLIGIGYLYSIVMVSSQNLIGLQTRVPLAGYTTIRLGGEAKFFLSCQTVDELSSALHFANAERLRVIIMGGGSNIVFSDGGVDGLVIKIDLRGISIEDGSDYASVHAGAGEVWDNLVGLCVANKFAGVECLSGIPGSVGATPIQNVGAYGQEVKDVIESVKAIDRHSGELVEISSAECGFGYRKSRFKSEDKERFVIVEVTYKFRRSDVAVVRYAELMNYLEAESIAADKCSLADARNAVLELRRKKSMLIDENDPNSRSVGSFFVNPVLSEMEFSKFAERLKANNIDRAPGFKSDGGIKIPAAWLVENSGFRKGYKRNGVGISSNHALALVNYSGTSAGILSLAQDIESAVSKKFGINLEREAVVI